MNPPKADQGYGRPSLRAVGYTSRKPGVLGCSFGYAQDKLTLRRTVQVRLGTNTLRSAVGGFMKYQG